MIDLYALTSPNIVKVFIALEELELPYNTIPVDVWKGDQFTPEFTRLNPNRKIPVIVDHEGPGGKPYTVFESGAILLYLADKTGRLLPADKAQRFDVIQWLMVQMASLGPMCGQLVHFRRFAPQEGNAYALGRYTSEVNRLFDLYETQLAAHPFAGGGDYTIADIAAFPWLRYTEILGMSLDKRPHLARWLETMNSRPAVQRTLAKVAAITSTRDTASDDDRDRFFNRGKYARAS